MQHTCNQESKNRKFDPNCNRCVINETKEISELYDDLSMTFEESHSIRQKRKSLSQLDEDWDQND